jgi:serpin B
MRRTSEFAWARVEGLSLVELPYEGDRLSMVVLLPDSTDGLPQLEARISLVQLDTWLSSLRPTLVQVLLPRFRMQAGYDLIPSLNSLGMRSAFVARVADFSGIDGGKEPLWIDHIAHKAYVDVNERGTEAAAATELVLRTIGYAAEEKRPQVFWVDHPFLFLVRDRLTGAIVFLGRVVDPSPA